MLCSDVIDKEVKEVMLDIDDFKFCGSNGFNFFFFKRVWNVVGFDIIFFMREFFINGICFKFFNYIDVILIFKVIYLFIIKEYIFIIYCCVVYKVIFKIMVRIM